MTALEGRPAPGTPPLTGWAARGGALGIWACSGGTFLAAGMILGLFKFAWAILMLDTGRGGGN